MTEDERLLLELTEALEARFPNIEVELIQEPEGWTIYALPKNAAQPIRVFMDGDHYEMGVVGTYDRKAKANPSMRSPRSEAVIEFIEDLGHK